MIPFRSFLILIISSFLLLACQNTLKSESGLYEVELHRNLKVPVDGCWTWGKGNPYKTQKNGYVYIHPMDVSKIRKKYPEESELMVSQMQDALTQEIASSLKEINLANGLNWHLTTNSAIADVCIHTAIVQFRYQRPGVNTINTLSGPFMDIPGVSQVFGIIGAGKITLECTMRDARTGQLLMAFKDSNRKTVHLYQKEAYSFSGNADINLKAWAKDIAKVLRFSANDKLHDSTLRKQIDDKSYWDVITDRAYEKIPETEEIDAWKALD